MQPILARRFNGPGCHATSLQLHRDPGNTLCLEKWQACQGFAICPSETSDMPENELNWPLISFAVAVEAAEKDNDLKSIDRLSVVYSCACCLKRSYFDHFAKVLGHATIVGQGIRLWSPSAESRHARWKAERYAGCLKCLHPWRTSLSSSRCV